MYVHITLCTINYQSNIVFVETTEKSSTPVKGVGAEANLVTLPSFFPTKEELEAKLLAAKKQPAKV